MKGGLITLLLACGLCAGQSSIPLNPNQQVFASVSAAGPSVAVQNPGQAEHIFLYNFVNAPGHADCATVIAAGAWSIFRFEGSGDGTTWIPLTSLYTNSVSGNPAAAVTGYFSAYGAYPYIRINVLTFGNSTACRLNGWYSGSLFPASPNDVAFQSSGLNSGTSVVNSTGDNLLVTTNPSNGQAFGLNLVIYGLYLWNSASNSINLYCKTASSGAVNGTFLSLPSFPANQFVTLPASSRGYFSCPSQNQMYVNLSANTNVSVFVLYRFE